MSRKSVWFWTVFAVFLILDQATKIWVYTQLEYRVDEISVFDGPISLSIVHAQNPGAAFGMLGDVTPAVRFSVFGVISIAALFLIWDMYRKLPASDRWQSFSLGLMLSGAVGNAIDRIHKQSVTDFVRIYAGDADTAAWFVSKFGTSEYPAWNVADAALLVGVILFFIQGFFAKSDEAENDAFKQDSESAS